MKLLYYISPFGFGHLTRSCAVLERMLEQDAALTISIKCQPRHRLFAVAYLQRFAARIDWQEFHSSFSIHFDQKKMAVDIEATRLDALRWTAGLAAAAKRELDGLRGAYDFVVSDIAPEAFVVAQQLNVPGVALSNFTWYEICRAFCSDAELKPLYDQYARATLQLEYAMATNGPIANRRAVGAVSRPLDASRIAALRRRYKQPGRPLVFLSIGGALELNGLPLSSEVDFLHTQGVTLPKGANGWTVPHDALDTQQYLAACDGVVTKCGWSTVSEARIAGKPLLVLKSSNGWPEEAAIWRAIEREPAVCECRANSDGRLPENWLRPLLATIERGGRVDRWPNEATNIARKLLELGTAQR